MCHLSKLVWIWPISTKIKPRRLSDLPSGSANPCDCCHLRLFHAREENSRHFQRWTANKVLRSHLVSSIPTAANPARGSKTQLGILWGCHIQSLDPASAFQPVFFAPRGNPDRYSLLRWDACAPFPGNRAWLSLDYLQALGTWRVSKSNPKPGGFLRPQINASSWREGALLKPSQAGSHQSRRAAGMLQHSLQPGVSRSAVGCQASSVLSSGRSPRGRDAKSPFPSGFSRLGAFWKPDVFISLIGSSA